MLFDRATRLWKNHRLEVTASALSLLAVGLLAAGYHFQNESFAGTLTAAGSGLLGGGVFTWLTKLAQISGVFREELEKVLISGAFIDRRSDRDELVVRLMQSLHGERFPGIKKKITKQSLSSVWPTGARHYLKNVVRRISVTLPDPAGNDVLIRNDMSADLYTDAENGEIVREHKYEFVPNATDPAKLDELLESKKHHYRLVDASGQDQERVTDELVGIIDMKNGNREALYRARLAPSSRYRVTWESEQHQDLVVDNLIGFLANTYIDGMQVAIEYDNKNLNLQFMEVGTEFADDRSKAGMIRRTSEKLLFSDVGYFVTIQRSIELAGCEQLEADNADRC